MKEGVGMSNITKKMTNCEMIPFLISNDKFRGGIYNPPREGRIVRAQGSLADEWYEESPFLKDQPKQYKGKYLYAGPLYKHYGHIMTESIHRLYAYDDSYDGIVFIAAAFSYQSCVSMEPPKYLLEIIKLLNIPLEKIVIITSRSILEEVVLVEPGSTLMNGAKEWYLGKLKEIRLPSTIKSIKNIYLGRVHIIQQGSIVGESYICNELLSNGFSYIAPEQYSIQDQINLIRNAERIVFLEGSSIYAAELLGEIKANIFMIPRRNYDTFFRPHLENKSEFSTIGDLKMNKRIENLSGSLKPDSPTITKAPQIIINDLYKNGLIKNDNFSKSKFNEYVKLDLLRYYGNKPDKYRNAIKEVEKIYQNIDFQEEGQK